jgi:hypothetical protein
MTKSILFVIIGLVLGSCSYLQSATQSVKTVNDTIAQTLIIGMCGITVGAYYRLKNPLHKEAINKLCGGDNIIELGE